MILVTGAAGKTGQAVIRALVARKTAVRALVHKQSHIQAIQELGTAEIVVGDMASPDTVTQAAQGVNAIYHICPNVHPLELEIGKNVIQAAQSTSVERLVYHSVFHPQIEAMPHHWQKMRVEEQVYASGLAYTILQPAPYMQNILAYIPSMKTQGYYSLPYSPEVGIGCVDLIDVAEVVAISLCESKHAGATYELCGVSNMSALESARILSQQLRQEIQVKVISIETWSETARKNGLAAYQVQTLSKMFRYYDKHGYMGNTQILSALLKRQPTDFPTFVQREIK